MNSIQNLIKVKTIRFFLAVILLAGTSLIAPAQSNDIKLKIEVVDASSPQSEDGAINITVESSGSGFTYMLYNKEPWKGGEKLAPDSKSGDNYSFVNLRSGNYCVCVQNRDEVIKCTNVLIKPKK
jgi:hypothetical protein